jgi:hypothetical protein
MLLNKHLYNRALKKKKNDQKKRGLDSLTPKTSLDGLSINLQKELLKEEKPDEFKKVVIKDKKKDNKDDKKIIIKEEVQEEEFSHISNVEDLEEDDKGEILGLEPDEEFEVIDNEQKEDLESENDLIEGPDKDQSGGGLNDIKKVVVSFF